MHRRSAAAFLITVAVSLGAVAACTREPPRIVGVTIPGDTRDAIGPYRIRAIVDGAGTGAGGIDVVVRWTTAGVAPFATVLATVDGDRADDFTAELPGHTAGTTLSFYVAARRDSVELATSPADAPRAAAGDAAPQPGGGETYSFRVLGRSEACRADSDCLGGVEICAVGTCRAFTGRCVHAGGTPACPTGYVCDPIADVCAVAPTPCTADAMCPTAETCDLLHGVCAARPGCVTDLDCPEGLSHCDPGLALCVVPM